MGASILLDGHSLTTAQIAAVARKNVSVELDPSAVERAAAARKVVLELADSDRPIYGLNTGLGANKDNHIEPEAYQRFNVRILHSHSVALPLIGEGYVEFLGDRMPAAEALRRCELSPVQLGPKDGLPLVSSNAFSVAKATLICEDVGTLLRMADAVYATGYEALGYDPMFLDRRGLVVRPLEGHRCSLDNVHACLEGSKLWDSGSEGLGRALSYKSGCSIYGVVPSSASWYSSVSVWSLSRPARNSWRSSRRALRRNKNLYF